MVDKSIGRTEETVIGVEEVAEIELELDELDIVAGGAVDLHGCGCGCPNLKNPNR
ncbi:hypothetical protein [Sorangium sp. So ce394]|uniref:hypothetical protein n=1 Tax=Sorangium sp. So ce394 TaxID=3133310 RepID=UPI003F5C6DC3